MKNLRNSLKIRNFVILNNLYLAQHSTAQHSTLLSSWFSVYFFNEQTCSRDFLRVGLLFYYLTHQKLSYESTTTFKHTLYRLYGRNKQSFLRTTPL